MVGFLASIAAGIMLLEKLINYIYNQHIFNYVVAVIMGWIPEGIFDIYHALLISASAVLTASIASFVLG